MPVAVLIVNFRAYAELDRCLGALETLAADDEIIVVDHASDAARLDAVVSRHPRATAIATADNPGFAAGVNRAAKQARAPYLLLLNPDAIADVSVVRTLEQWLVEHPGTAVVGPRVVNGDGTVQPSARGFPDVTTALGGRSSWLSRRFPTNWLSRRNLRGTDATSPMVVDWVAGACLMTRRDVFERLGGLDDGFFLYWEDADYGRRVDAAGFESVYLPQVVVRHAGAASARFDRRRSIRALHRSAFRLYWKHSGPIGRLAAPVVGAALIVRTAWCLARAGRDVVPPVGPPADVVPR